MTNPLFALVTPLVLDLSGAGNFAFTPAPVAFDVYGTGETVNVGWPVGEVGFLALDLNANGAVDSGVELFGDATVMIADASRTAEQGFQALAQYDQDKNGVIDQRDAIFPKLIVWVDKNGDAKSAKEEIQSLDHYKITSLGLGFHAVSSPMGNGQALPLLMGRFSAQDAQGRRTTGVLADIYLRIF